MFWKSQEVEKEEKTQKIKSKGFGKIRNEIIFWHIWHFKPKLMSI